MGAYLTEQKLDPVIIGISQQFAHYVAMILKLDMSRVAIVRIYAVGVMGSMIGVDPNISDDQITKLAASWVPEGFGIRDIDELVTAITNLRYTSRRGMMELMHIARGLKAVPVLEHGEEVLGILQNNRERRGLSPSMNRLCLLGDLLFKGKPFLG